MKGLSIRFLCFRLLSLIQKKVRVTSTILAIFPMYIPLNVDNLNKSYLADKYPVLQTNKSSALEKTPLSKKLIILPRKINPGENIETQIKLKSSGFLLNQNLSSPDLKPQINESGKELPVSNQTPLSGKFTILPIGINLGESNVIPSTTVKGLENGKEAIDFNNWLIPFNDVIQALNFNVTKKDDGQLELRSVGLIIKFDPKILVNDPDIGQAISVEQIRNILKIPTEFSVAEYAIVLSPSWIGKSLDNKQYQEQDLPVIFKNLPQINPPFFSFQGITQTTNLGYSGVSNIGNNNNLNYQSEFKLLGSIVGGSLFANIQQFDQSTVSNRQLRDLQYFRPSPSRDYIIGTQLPFWTRVDRNQTDYLGATLIQRLGYTPPNNSSFSDRGFNPQIRLSSNEVVRTIKGKAAPGTLVQLVTQNANLIVSEKLVDDSGNYRFENVVTASNSFGRIGGSVNYKLLLYSGGNLSAKPEEVSLNYQNLQGQINRGKSAFIISAGTKRTELNQSFFGNTTNFQGGATYYLGLSDQITLGTGIVYNNSTKVYNEIFYQPVNFPLTFRLGALTGNTINFNADVIYRTNNFGLSFGGDENYYNSNLYWSLNPEFSLFSNWYSGISNQDNNRLETGFNLNLKPVSLTVSYDTKNVVNLSLRSRLDPFLISTRKYKQQTSSELIYNLSGNRFFTSTGHAIRFNYDTNNKDYLGILNWIYRTPFTDKNGRSLLDLELGYGSGSNGSGMIASASTGILPGLGLRLTYRDVSLSDNNSSLSLNFFTSLLLQPSINFSNDETKLEKLRAQGGIFLQPFLDRNNNGLLDHGEKIYTEDIEALFLINNQPLNELGVFRPNIIKNGALFELPPGNYRLDIDPAGYPLGWKAVQPAYAVKVAAGTYTKVLVPLTPSYVVTGRVLNQEQKPLNGVQVEAISRSNPEKRFVSVTNNAGIYYLEDLKIGAYNLFIDGKPAQPNSWEIKTDSETFFELNLQQ
jgi:hypothetical protein